MENYDITIIDDQTRHLTKAIGTIKSDVMQAVNLNKDIYYKCVTDGEQLLAQADVAMDDNLDEQISSFIKGTKKGIVSMGENRKPITQIFDMVRKGFTTMEDMLSPKNENSVIYKLQEKRDEYAKQKIILERQREEERQRLERIKAAKDKLAQDTRSVCNDILTDKLNASSSEINTIFSLITLSNKDVAKERLQNYPTEISLGKLLADRKPSVPIEVDESEAKNIMNAIYKEVHVSIETQYATSIKSQVDELLLKFDSKIQELEIAEKARQEAEQKRLEAERIAAEAKAKAEKAAAEAKAKADKEAMARAEEERKKAEEAEKAAEEQRKAEEAEKAAALENERLLREADEKAAKEQQEKLAQEAEARKQQAQIADADREANSLFNQTVSSGAPVKAKITEHIEVLDKSGWLDIIQAWWVQKGILMDSDSLEKKLGFMKKVAEDLNNKSDFKIVSDNIAYIEDIKAK